MQIFKSSILSLTFTEKHVHVEQKLINAQRNPHTRKRNGENSQTCRTGPNKARDGFSGRHRGPDNGNQPVRNYRLTPQQVRKGVIIPSLYHPYQNWNNLVVVSR